MSRALVCALALAALPASARAYDYASPLARGCHEAITIAALRAVREELVTAAPMPPSTDDRAWIDDLPLELPDDVRDLGGGSLIAGVRDNDLKGRHGLDTSELALVHGDPELQHEHCLRRPEHDEPDGSAAALDECRAYVAEQASDAIDAGLDARGVPDPDARLGLAVYLAFAGEARVPAQRAYLQLGRGLHALQDSFSHALRSEDGLRVRSLLNWVDFVEEHHQGHRDGPLHRAALDQCEQLDALREQRLRLAIEASADYLRAALDPALDADDKRHALEHVLERYMRFEPGCDASNGFCDAPELGYREPAIGCAVHPGRATHAAMSAALLLLAATLAVRRRRRASLATVLALVLLALTSPAAASAQTARSRFAFASKASLSIDETAAAAALGARYRAGERWLFGLDAEWNPWASFETSRVRPGTLNLYGTVSLRTPVSRAVALRTTAHAGVSRLLFDLYGAPAGSVGPYAALSLLGLEIGLVGDARLLLEPAEVAVAMPHLTGIPFTHRQYRASVGIELGF